jgi:membrane protease YdiL (CAAX protease family)
LDARQVKGLLSHQITENVRCKWYLSALIWGWIPVVAVAVICRGSADISLADIGLRTVSLTSHIVFRAITFTVAGGLFVVCLYQVLSYLFSEKYRQSVKAKIAADTSGNAAVYALVIPRSKREKRLFALLSLTAGIGEEIVVRGFLFFLIQAIFPAMPLFFIVAIAGIVFGIGHLYQGPAGVLKTGVAGALFGCLYLAAGSLIPGILLHIFVDFSSAFLLSEERSDCNKPA